MLNVLHFPLVISWIEKQFSHACRTFADTTLLGYNSTRNSLAGIVGRWYEVAGGPHFVHSQKHSPKWSFRELGFCMSQNVYFVDNGNCLARKPWYGKTTLKEENSSSKIHQLYCYGAWTALDREINGKLLGKAGSMGNVFYSHVMLLEIDNLIREVDGIGIGINYSFTGLPI